MMPSCLRWQMLLMLRIMCAGCTADKSSDRVYGMSGQVLPGPPAMPPAGASVPAGMPMHMAPSVEPAAATPYLEVNGMVTPEVLMDDEEYKEVRHPDREA